MMNPFTPVLADFGISMIEDKLSLRNFISGTKKYMSPRLINANFEESNPYEEYNYQLDFYALGMIFYDVLVEFFTGLTMNEFVYSSEFNDDLK